MRIRCFGSLLVAVLTMHGLGKFVAATEPEPPPQGTTPTAQPPDEDMRRDVWAAVLRALAAQGLTTEYASFEQGQVATAFVTWDVKKLSEVATLAEAEQTRSWVGAEYRYVVNIGDHPDRVRVGVSAEIHAWTAEDQAAEAEKKRILPSNRTLEKAFMQAFSEALGG